MIVKENGLRYAKLIHVSVDNGRTDNSNKIYIMEELSDGRIRCDYGRVGRTLTTEYKPKDKWSSVYKQKLSKTKGYTDVTEFIVEPVINKNGGKVLDISDSDVKKLINDLMAYANKSIKNNYKVTQESVSEKQVDSAQEIINQINSELDGKFDFNSINQKLIKLYSIIPRKMDNVKLHLLSDNIKAKATELISNEQDVLDVMAGQVQLLKQKSTSVSDETILNQMGISISVETDKEQLKLVHKLVGDNISKVKNIFKVNNIKTKQIFDKNFETAKVKKKRLYFHGSRNENWFNLLQSGLLIRPAGAVYTGSMFGDAIYLADKSQKALGYSSLKGSYWAKGSDNKGYLALIETHIGNQKHIYKHDSSCYRLNYKDLQKENYDSVFAHGGWDLRNDEFVIYNNKQCTIAYLIEMEK